MTETCTGCYQLNGLCDSGYSPWYKGRIMSREVSIFKIVSAKWSLYIEMLMYFHF